MEEPYSLTTSLNTGESSSKSRCPIASASTSRAPAASIHRATVDFPAPGFPVNPIAIRSGGISGGANERRVVTDRLPILYFNSAQLRPIDVSTGVGTENEIALSIRFWHREPISSARSSRTSNRSSS